MLVVDGLVHVFDQRAPSPDPALDIPALAVAAGQLTVIAGPSGSGKSTLLYLLGGLLRPWRGSIRWDGIDLAALGEGARDRWRRRQAGFVFQNFHLIDEMSAIGNATVAAYFDGFSNAGVRARARTLLESFGLADLDRRPVASFSRGEQQRVALARALLRDPAILFADEPTASLDRDNAAMLATTLKGLAADSGKTVLAVSHDPVLLDAADRIVRLERGRIVAATDNRRAA